MMLRLFLSIIAGATLIAAGPGARASVDNREVHMLFADAAWARSVEAPGERAALAEESFAAAQDATNSQTAAALAQMGARFAAGSDALAAVARRRQDAEARLRSADQRLLQALGEGKAESAKLLRAEMDKLGTELSQLDSEIRKRFPEYASLVSPASVPSAEVKRLLRGNEGVLFIIPGKRGTHVFAVWDKGLRWHHAKSDAAAIGATVTALRCGASLGCGEDQSIYDRKAAYRLYQELLEPVIDMLAGKDELFVIASGPLGSLPFAMLVTAPPEGLDDDEEALRKTSWLIDRFALTSLPSISSLKALRTFQRRGATSGAFVGFGDPILPPPPETKLLPEPQPGIPRAPTKIGRGSAGDAFAGGSSDASGTPLANPESIRKIFTALPGTREELTAMQGAFGAGRSKVWLGGEATEANVKKASLEKASVVAFATHGILAGEFPGFSEPGLIFTPPGQATAQDDGILSASEAAQLQLSADWVILSACNTAGADGELGSEGLSGLARAFFYAGARALLVSHWPIFDDVAAVITVDVVRRQGANPSLSRAQALRQAMLAIRQDKREGWSHPGSWAPFVLVGETLERKAAALGPSASDSRATGASR
jgi:CHAT domain-containing protein